MKDYLQQNQEFWQISYPAENVESFVFRTYGRILKPEFGLSGDRHEKLLDFGCGSGATLRFFKQKGFDVYGVDISEPAIALCRERMGDIAGHFALIDPQPTPERTFFGGQFDLITAVQSLYYFSDTDLDSCLASLHAQLKPGGILYATMIGTQSGFYAHSTPLSEGLRTVNMKTQRVHIENYHVNFTEDTEHLTRKFARFEPLHTGYYTALYLEEEGPDFHYTFIGRKQA